MKNTEIKEGSIEELNMLRRHAGIPESLEWPGPEEREWMVAYRRVLKQLYNTRAVQRREMAAQFVAAHIAYAGLSAGLNNRSADAIAQADALLAVLEQKA